MDNLKLLKGSGKTNEIKEGIRTLQSNMADMKIHMGLVAQLTRVKYDALIIENFTPEQALELSKNIF